MAKHRKYYLLEIEVDDESSRMAYPRIDGILADLKCIARDETDANIRYVSVKRNVLWYLGQAASGSSKEMRRWINKIYFYSREIMKFQQGYRDD